MQRHIIYLFLVSRFRHSRPDRRIIMSRALQLLFSVCMVVVINSLAVRTIQSQEISKKQEKAIRKDLSLFLRALKAVSTDTECNKSLSCLTRKISPLLQGFNKPNISADGVSFRKDLCKGCVLKETVYVVNLSTTISISYEVENSLARPIGLSVLYAVLGDNFGVNNLLEPAWRISDDGYVQVSSSKDRFEVSCYLSGYKELKSTFRVRAICYF
jgi:hypothetical protein